MRPEKITLKPLVLAVTFATLVLSATAVRADITAEITNAGMHAGLAAGAGDLATVHQHLHHALNCLVGPNGNGFDAKEINPCQNSGHGAIPDESDQGKKKALEAAADKARAGIAEADLSKAKNDAADAAAMLRAIK